MPSSQHLTSPASLERLVLEAAVTGVEVMADALASAAGTGAAQAAAASQALASVEEMTWRLLQQAAAAFGSFAVASRDISATIERAVEVVTHELATPMGAVVQLLGPGKVAVVHSRGLVGLACGEEFEVDPELPTVHVPCEPSVMEDWRTEPGFPRTHATTDAGIRARMSVSIPVQGRPWGRLIVSDTQPRQFAGTEVEFVQAVAVALAAALEKEQVEAGRAAVAAFGRFARASPDVASTIERAVDVVTRVLEVPLGAVVRQLGLPGRLALVQAWGPVGLDLGEAYDVDPALARAFRTTQPLVIEDWRTDDRFATPILAASARSIASLSVAVLVAHRVWGRLIVADTRARQFSDADTDVVSAVANALATALEPAQARAP